MVTTLMWWEGGGAGAGTITVGWWVGAGVGRSCKTEALSLSAKVLGAAPPSVRHRGYGTALQNHLPLPTAWRASTDHPSPSASFTRWGLSSL